MKTVLLTLLIMSLPAVAKPVKPNSVKPVYSEVTAKINYGRKVSNFKIWNDENGRHLAFENSEGHTKNLEMDPIDFDFVMLKAKEGVKHSSNDLKFCERTYMTLQASQNGKTETRKACIGSSSALAKKITKLTNVLRLLL